MTLKPTFFILLVLLVTGLFLSMRFYHIETGLFFYNDMGRDLLVLQNWKNTGKPPLLGPQTSALPFNQSAVYFYMLYPAFILTNQSPYTALITTALVYLLVFYFLFYIFRHQPKISYILLIVFYLVSIHPQCVSQSRYVWNPTFVTPFLILCFVSLYQLLKQFNLLYLALFSFSLALAVSLSYSVAPTFLTLLLLLPFLFRRKTLVLFSALFVSLFVVNLPTLAFELRHNFLLTNALLANKSPTQGNLSLSIKFPDLSFYLFDSPLMGLNIILLLTAIAISFVVLFKSSTVFSKVISFLFLSSSFLGLLLPISLQAHYVFGILTAAFFLFSLTKTKLLIPLLAGLTLLYLNPLRLNHHFKPAPRSYSQLDSCFSSFCQSHPGPLFVSVTSTYHPYHNGPEHRYLLSKNGCQVAEVEKDASASNLMALVVDGGSFDPQKTKFYELDLFGNYKIINTTNCQPNLQVILLQKNI